MVRFGNNNNTNSTAGSGYKGKLLVLQRTDPIKLLFGVAVVAGISVLVISVVFFFASIQSAPLPGLPLLAAVTTTPSSSTDRSNPTSSSSHTPTCPYMKLVDLSASERYPFASAVRHMVNPPADIMADTSTTHSTANTAEAAASGVALVCCETTKGPWNILVHHSWAKIGARRFLDLVQSKHFHQSVPLMRCVENFLCQFGLNGNINTMKRFQNTIPDDPNWLPEGKEFRKNELNVKRFQRGYLAYAGSGTNSRNLQFIVALADSGPLAGGSPWEVPWGELVGDHSYQTLAKIYTGYGEQGPKQGLLWKPNALEYVHKHFPNMDYIQSCDIVDAEGGQGIPMSTAAY